MHEGIFEVIATNGDTHLGGDDIDHLLIAIALDDIAAISAWMSEPQREAVQAIRKAVIDAKIALSANESDDAGCRASRRQALSARDHARAVRAADPAGDRSHGRPVKQALKDAGLTAGADRRGRAGRRFDAHSARAQTGGGACSERKPHTDLNPDEVVALGAAVQANILSGGSEATKDMLLLDVTPLSLGIEALGGVVAKIIQRNSTIPASATEHFTTGVEGQTNVAIHVVQGERELAKDCRSLARFDLKGIPPMLAGLPRIEVKFLIDANGILHVTAREQRSGKEAEIEVKPSYGLTDEQVENMILESFDNAEEDIRAAAGDRGAERGGDDSDCAGEGPQQSCVAAVSSQERTAIDKQETALRAVLKEDDYQAIRNAIDALNQGTMRLAELMMDSAVSAALKGKAWRRPTSAKGRQHRIRSRRRRLSEVAVAVDRSVRVGAVCTGMSGACCRERAFRAALRAADRSRALQRSGSAGEVIESLQDDAKPSGPSGPRMKTMADEKITRRHHGNGGSASVQTPSASPFFRTTKPSSLNTASFPTRITASPSPFSTSRINFGLHLEHACGGNCACTTCHVVVKKGKELLSEMDDEEADRLDMAADLQLNSRLGCQAVIEKPGEVVVEIPILESQLRF